MTVETSGQQLRIRVRPVNMFRHAGSQNWGTQSFGVGRLQRVAGRLKRTGAWATQSWRLNLNMYHNWSAIATLISLYDMGEISLKEEQRGMELIEKWFKTHA